ncbi:unnamed protein product [Ambrosiozyma monospora]|uniref:Unnamed protein product n=1 Tax=Ambrosiozyma monospora TaxID=43982 RepID=A0ACB5T123_AMBMO|nr:unnamed protein product [Ambrosiozyma monospora]
MFQSVHLGLETDEEFKKFIESHKDQFTTQFNYYGKHSYDSDDDPQPEKTIVYQTEPIKDLVTGMEIRVEIEGTMKFDFLKQYTELEYLSAKALGLDEVSSTDHQRIMKLKLFDGLAFTFPKLKILDLLGFAITKELFGSFLNSLTSLYMKDCIPLDQKQYGFGLGLGLLKFPTGLQAFKFDSTNEARYKFPIISNTKDLICLKSVVIYTENGEGFVPKSLEPRRSIP